MTIKPYNWLFFDTEAYIHKQPDGTEEHTLRLGYAKYVRLNQQLEIVRSGSTTFRTGQELMDFIDRYTGKDMTLHVVAHNIIYDIALTGLLNILMERGWEMTRAYVKGITTIIWLTKGKRRMILEDGMNRLRGKIKDWGEVVGLPKGTVDFLTVSDQELLEYCIRDVDILTRMTLEYLRFCKDNDLGEVAYTISGQAFNAYRHRFMRHRIRIHNNEDVIALEREAYGGGMVRVFKVGEFTDGPFYKLDVNSMYPSVMHDYVYPRRLVRHATAPTLQGLSKALRVGCVIARCTVNPSEPVYRYRHKGKIIYPCFEFTGTFTTPELQRLLNTGSILEVHEMAVYAAEPLFVDYVNYFWELRRKAKQEDNRVYDQLAKQMMNSLYGKFGVRGGGFERYPDYDDNPAGQVWTEMDREGLIRKYFVLGGKVYRETLEGTGYNAFVAIAAHVTAYARLRLWNFVQIAGEKNVYYTDTDSLIVNQAGYENLNDYIIPSALGFLKVEKISQTLAVYSRKDYVMGDEVVLKGVTYYMQIGDITIPIREAWPTFNQLVHNYQHFHTAIRQIKVQLKRTVYDGWVTQDGTVVPFTSLPDLT